MYDKDKEILTLLRCPALSDGSKITLITWVFYARDRNAYPSLEQTANLRGCRRSTIQAHLKEALDAGFITKKNLGRVSLYTFQWDALASAVGYPDFAAIRFEQLAKTPTPKDTTPVEMALRVLPRQEIRSSRQLLTYFKAMYREKLGEEYKGCKADQNKCRGLINEYGAAKAIDMVNFFLAHRKRLCLGETTVDTLYRNKEHIYDKACRV